MFGEFVNKITLDYVQTTYVMSYEVAFSIETIVLAYLISI